MNFCARMANQLLLNEVEKGSGENFVVSPLSFNAVLNMVAAGSTGATLQQMLSLLEFENIDDVNSEFLDMMTIASTGLLSLKGNCGPTLSLVNRIWIDKHFRVKPSYQEIAKSIYKTEVKNVDFATKADEIVEEANSWAKNATKGLIKAVLQRENFNPDTKLLLGNALYFKGAWYRNEFNHKKTEKRDFYLVNGNKVSVPFMTSNNKYLYGSFNGFKVLKIPYQQGQDRRMFSMYFFLPDERDGLQNLLTKVNSNPGFLHQDFELRNVKLLEFWIPKFKFSSHLIASRAMEEMGLTLPFMRDCMELTEMVHVPAGVPFYVSQIIQKAFIEVDEEGTEAAAVTLGLLVVVRDKYQSQKLKVL